MPESSINAEPENKHVARPRCWTPTSANDSAARPPRHTRLPPSTNEREHGRTADASSPDDTKTYSQTLWETSHRNRRRGQKLQRGSPANENARKVHRTSFANGCVARPTACPRARLRDRTHRCKQSGRNASQNQATAYAAVCPPASTRGANSEAASLKDSIWPTST